MTVPFASEEARNKAEESLEHGQAQLGRQKSVGVGSRWATAIQPDAGRLSYVPKIPSPKVTAVREGFFTDADLEALLPKLPGCVRPAVRFAYLTGWRKREILNPGGLGLGDGQARAGYHEE